MLCGFLPLALALVSCSSGPPEILGVEWNLETRPMAGGVRETRNDLAVFARIHDPDGVDDIESLWVIDDAAELTWHLGPSSWTKRSLGEEDWFGAAGLTMPDGSAPPPGHYRFVAADLAGNRVDYAFTISNLILAETLPVPEWKGGRVTLSARWPENYLLAYDAAGSLLRSAVLPREGGSLASIVGSVDASRTAAFAVYGYDPSNRRGAFSERISIR